MVAHSCSSKGVFWVLVSSSNEAEIWSALIQIFFTFFFSLFMQLKVIGGLVVFWTTVSTSEIMTLDLFNQIISRLRVKIAELVSHKELWCSLGSNPSPEIRRLWQGILHSSAWDITERSFNCNSSIYQATQLSGDWREDEGNDSACYAESLAIWGLFCSLICCVSCCLEGPAGEEPRSAMHCR